MVFHFPLRQHIGAPSVPVVAVGAQVRRGQLIAQKPDGMPGAALHSSVTGRVSALTDMAIDIIPDEGYETETDYLPLPGATPRELVEASGLVGLGGAGFPTWRKLAPLPGGTVILNAAECEPILCHNMERLTREPVKTLRGLRIAMELTQADRGIIAIKAEHAEAIAALRATLCDGITLCTLPSLYPAGEERAIVREALGVLPNVDELPASAGAVVLNAETLYRLAEAVDDRKPLIDKDVTVAGKLSGAPVQVFANVPLGLPAEALLARAGGPIASYGELIMGGPFTGRRITPQSPIVKTTGGLLVTEEFPARRRRMGLLVCACGPDEARLQELAASMEGTVVGIVYCKQAHKVKSGYKCENPGHCPGQAQKVLELKKAGAEELLIGNCSDCTNTVMSCAPRLGLTVHHATDGALRAVHHRLIRFTAPRGE